MDRKFISSGQIAIIFAALGVWYCAAEAVYTDAGGMSADIVVSAVFAIILSVPLCLLCGRFHCSVPEAASKSWGAFGKAVALVYGAYFISVSAELLRVSGTMAADVMFGGASPVICIILLGIVCGYISHTGTAAVCRMTTVMLFLIILSIILSVISCIINVEHYEYMVVVPERLSLSALGMKGILPLMAAGAVLMCVLTAGAGRRTGRGMLIGIAVMTILAVGGICAVFLILGDYIGRCGYPLAEAVRYTCGMGGFMPYGIYYGLWIMISSAAAALFSAAGGICLRAAVSRIKWEGIISSAAALAGAIVCYYTKIMICTGFYRNIYIVVLLLTVIPSALLICEKKEGRKAK